MYTKRLVKAGARALAVSADNLTSFELLARIVVEMGDGTQEEKRKEEEKKKMEEKKEDLLQILKALLVRAPAPLPLSCGFSTTKGSRASVQRRGREPAAVPWKIPLGNLSSAGSNRSSNFTCNGHANERANADKLLAENDAARLL